MNKRADTLYDGEYGSDKRLILRIDTDSQGNYIEAKLYDAAADSSESFGKIYLPKPNYKKESKQAPIDRILSRYLKKAKTVDVNDYPLQESQVVDNIEDEILEIYDSDSLYRDLGVSCESFKIQFTLEPKTDLSTQFNEPLTLEQFEKISPGLLSQIRDLYTKFLIKVPNEVVGAITRKGTQEEQVTALWSEASLDQIEIDQGLIIHLTYEVPVICSKDLV